LLYYHGQGYLDELQTNPENLFNPQAKTGRLFPSLDWIVPDETTYNIDEPEKEFIKMCFYFSDLQGYTNKGVQDTRSRTEVWRDLLKIAKRFVLRFNRALCELNVGGIQGTVTLKQGAFATKRRQQDINVCFDLLLDSECIDVDGDPVPTLNETCDLENYCFCTEIP
jgi:hypothetical protein